MAKKHISSTDLSWQFFEMMRADPVFEKAVAVAVVADPKLGWRAVIAERNSMRMSTVARKRLELFEERLRSRFALSND